MPHHLGQVFLKDQNIIRKILSVADLTSTDHVVEIGCGEGFFSKWLCDHCQQLTIIELDPIYAQQTSQRLQGQPKVTMIQANALTVDYATLTPQPFKVVSNVPYYISAKLMQVLVRYRHLISSTTMMVQHEFAKKLTAKPGESLYCSLGVYIQFYMQVSYCFKVSKQCFRPIPKIDSAVIHIIPRKKPLFDVDEDLFFQITKSVFWGRRKPLLSALKKSPFFEWKSSYDLLPIWQDLGKKRGETLDLAQFYSIYQAIKS